MELSQSDQQGRFSGYVSPWRALAWSFHKSRENWKRKYAAVKRDVKRSQNEARDVRKSRERWKEKAKAFETENNSLQATVAELQARLAAQELAAEKKTPQAICH
jgi:septal ring factor EnvC (AmiA/AmiB activator)